MSSEFGHSKRHSTDLRIPPISNESRSFDPVGRKREYWQFIIALLVTHGPASPLSPSTLPTPSTRSRHDCKSPKWTPLSLQKHVSSASFVLVPSSPLDKLLEFFCLASASIEPRPLRLWYLPFRTSMLCSLARGANSHLRRRLFSATFPLQMFSFVPARCVSSHCHCSSLSSSTSFSVQLVSLVQCSVTVWYMYIYYSRVWENWRERSKQCENSTRKRYSIQGYPEYHPKGLLCGYH